MHSLVLATLFMKTVPFCLVVPCSERHIPGIDLLKFVICVNSPPLKKKEKKKKLCKGLTSFLLYPF